MMIPMGLSVKSYERIKHFKNFSFESEKGMGH